MSKNFVDLAAAQRNGTMPRDLPHGVVLPPPIVREQVDKEKARLAEFYTPEFEKRILDELTLAHYFEGEFVAYRSVPEGLMIFAVGTEEVERYVNSTPAEEQSGVVFEHP